MTRQRPQAGEVWRLEASASHVLVIEALPRDPIVRIVWLDPGDAPWNQGLAVTKVETMKQKGRPLANISPALREKVKLASRIFGGITA